MYDDISERGAVPPSTMILQEPGVGFPPCAGYPPGPSLWASWCWTEMSVSENCVFACISAAFSSCQNTLVASSSSTSAIPDLATPVRSPMLLGLASQNKSEDSSLVQGTLLNTVTFPVNTLYMLVVRIPWNALVVEPGISVKGYITISPKQSSHAVTNMCPMVLFSLDDSLPILKAFICHIGKTQGAPLLRRYRVGHIITTWCVGGPGPTITYHFYVKLEVCVEPWHVWVGRWTQETGGFLMELQGFLYFSSVLFSFL